MNYGDHNFIEITQQTKLRVAPVALVVSNVSSRVQSRCNEPSGIRLMLVAHVKRQLQQVDVHKNGNVRTSFFHF